VRTDLDDGRHEVCNIIQAVLVEVKVAEIAVLSRAGYDLGSVPDSTQREEIFDGRVHVRAEDTGGVRLYVSGVDVGVLVTPEWGFGARLLESMYRVVQRENGRGDMAVEAFVRSSTSCYLLVT
jgi:hypothetical protein